MRLYPLNALRAFESSARKLSFVKAAEELHVTPAAVSHQVKKLEEYLGLQLFRRLPRGLVLADSGQLLQAELREVFKRLDSAMELVLIGTGGCTAWDVVQILEKGREPIEDCVVELDAERADEDPMVFTRIHMRFIVTGRGLAPAKVERAIKLSADKYCSASAMLAKTAEITHEFEVIDTGGG